MSVDYISIIMSNTIMLQNNKKTHWFSFDTVLERKSWKAALEDAKTLYGQDENGSENSPIAEIAVGQFFLF